MAPLIRDVNGLFRFSKARRFAQKKTANAVENNVHGCLTYSSCRRAVRSDIICHFAYHSQHIPQGRYPRYCQYIDEDHRNDKHNQPADKTHQRQHEGYRSLVSGIALFLCLVSPYQAEDAQYNRCHGRVAENQNTTAAMPIIKPATAVFSPGSRPLSGGRLSSRIPIRSSFSVYAFTHSSCRQPSSSAAAIRRPRRGRSKAPS